MMYTIKPTAEFKRDYRQAQRKGLDIGPLNAAITALAAGETLPAEYRDRPLGGDMQGYRECRVEPNRLLVYYIDGEVLVLTLLRTGSREEVYHREGVSAVKPSKSLKSLYRSPLKTAVTLLLLIAASFMFLFNLAEYLTNLQEYQEALDKYQGVLAADQSLSPENNPLNDFFLNSDPTNPGRTYGQLSYEDYHQKDLSVELIQEWANLQYISRIEQRYMTAGISSQYQRLDTDTHFLAYTARCVLVGTLLDIRDDSHPWGEKYEQGWEKNLILGDVEMLAGDASWLHDLPEQLVEMRATNGEFRDEYHRWRTLWNSNRSSALCTDRRLFREDMEQLTPGRRYLLVMRDREDGLKSHTFDVGDDSLNDWWPYITDVTDLPEGWLETEEFAPLRELIQITNDDLHTFDVVYGNDMNAIRRVAEGRMICTAGRFLTPEDVDLPVCVVSQDFLTLNSLNIGDTITLNLGDYLCEQYAPLGALAVNRARYSTTFTEQTFTIIGAWQDLNEGNHVTRDLYWCWSNNAIFVPSAFLPKTADTENHLFKASDVSFVIDDAEYILPFVEKVLPSIEAEGVPFTFHDGGWSQIALDLIQGKDLTLVKLVVFSFAAVFAMVLTAWLFIGRKKREFGILRAMGMPQGEASMYLFYPFLLLGGLSTVLGDVGAGIVSMRQLAADGHKPIGPGLYLLGGLVFLLVLASLAWGGIMLIRRKSILALIRETDRRNIKEPELTIPMQSISETAFTSHDLGGSKTKNWKGRYLRRLLGRNLGRNFISLLLAALLVFAFGIVTVLRSIYKGLYQNVEIKPVISGGITINKAKMIAESGFVRDPYYEFAAKDGQTDQVPVEILLVNRLDHRVSDPIEWLPGWDEERAMGANEKICIMSASYAESLGKGLGDSVLIHELDWWSHVSALGLDPLKPGETAEDRLAARRPSVEIVGLIRGDETADILYLPTAAWNFYSFLTPTNGLDIAEYTLLNYHQAAEFEAYTQELLSSSRNAVKLTMDTSYADRIYKIHRLIETLYPLTVAAALILGCVLPGLTVLHSSREISILRALGVRARDCVILYTLSQVLCALAGLVLGVAAVIVALRPELGEVIVPFAIYLAAHLAACALGSGVFAWLCARKRVLEQLQAKE